MIYFLIMLWHNHCVAQMCLLIGTVSKVSEVAHEPLVMYTVHVHKTLFSQKKSRECYIGGICRVVTLSSETLHLHKLPLIFASQGFFIPTASQKNPWVFLRSGADQKPLASEDDSPLSNLKTAWLDTVW